MVHPAFQGSNSMRVSDFFAESKATLVHLCLLASLNYVRLVSILVSMSSDILLSFYSFSHDHMQTDKLYGDKGEEYVIWVSASLCFSLYDLKGCSMYERAKLFFCRLSVRFCVGKLFIAFCSLAKLFVFEVEQ